MQSARAAVAIAAALGWTLLLLPVQGVALALRLRLRATLPHFYHRWLARVLGVRIEVSGRRVSRGPALFTVNHSSWLDIVVLSATIPGSFVAKKEVASWPGVSILAKLQRSVFVAREVRQAAYHRDEIRARLEDGDLLILFPEGTSSDGNRVLPFKSAFFSVAETPFRGAPLSVQPVSVAYTRLNG
ncbi:MAG: 1-acyl-sn-glycerol-3-phosphate acyltransferase, partial [Alphaproteobacteria bacterium]|nr:1-acyl-sn-glycerol-3-phosphate acyltransferase [Alphaproteobacteria bacterium]